MDAGTQAPEAPTTAAAKANLLAWATAIDARTLKARSSLGTIATGGALAIVSGMVIARTFTNGRPRRFSRSPLRRAREPSIRWALLLRAAGWLLPRAIRAVRRGGESPSHAEVARPANGVSHSLMSVGA